MKLQLQEIGAALSDPSQPPVIEPGTPPDNAPVWFDSSLDLERGLDVVELSGDLLLSDLQEPARPPPLVLKPL
jgi:hypothetical protein